jgi:hypothetical protein
MNFLSSELRLGEYFSWAHLIAVLTQLDGRSYWQTFLPLASV